MELFNKHRVVTNTQVVNALMANKLNTNNTLINVDQSNEGFNKQISQGSSFESKNLL
jgi:hypothetical protein